MRRILMECPLENEEHERYATDCLIDCLMRGEAALVPRLHYARALDFDIQGERALSLQAGRTWLACADAVVLYVDYGVCSQMRDAMTVAESAGVPVEVRSLRGLSLPSEATGLREAFA